ncbi:MAG: AAA family ATPase [bacterium]|nr:AAA family ATPase [bacterium]
MPLNKMIQRSPVRIFEKVIGGGLGAGNLGVTLSRPGVGKTGFLIGLAVDQLLQGKKVLYISTKEPVDHISTFFEEIFQSMSNVLEMDNVLQRQLEMERNRQILVYNRKLFSLEKLEKSVAFLKETTGFEPDMVILDGTPRFENTEEWEVEGIKKLGAQWGAEIWTSSNTHREDQEMDARGVPRVVTRFEEHLNVIVALCPDSEHIKVNTIKEHGNEDIPQVSLELDPKTMLLRWR